jgi:hypothetical protein
VRRQNVGKLFQAVRVAAVDDETIQEMLIHCPAAVYTADLAHGFGNA